MNDNNAKLIAQAIRSIAFSDEPQTGAGYAAEMLKHSDPATRKRLLKTLKSKRPDSYQKIREKLALGLLGE